MATASLVLFWILVAIGLAVLVGLWLTWKIWLAIVIQALVRLGAFFDEVPEGYATAYESGGRFFALACSQKGFSPVEAPGNFDWAIRSLGEVTTLYRRNELGEIVKDADGKPITEERAVTKDDFYWDRRPWFVKAIFGEDTGIVWMGLWPIVRPKYYDLRISNFRTVKPSDEEIARKRASEPKDYQVNGQHTGWLISWNEWTKNVLLSDDIYPFPVDGVRIGACLPEKDKQTVLANILVFMRARIRAPYLFLYRGQDVLEIIQNEIIQHVRKLCANLTLDNAFSLTVTLESGKGKENKILEDNNFGQYIYDRYGFFAKGASFGALDIPGDAGVALSAPWIAKQNAEAEAQRGKGQGEAESYRITLEGEAFDKVARLIGAENAVMLRTSDVGESFASNGKSNTVVLGLDPKSLLGSILGGKLPPKAPEGLQGKEEVGEQQPQPK